MGGPVSRLREMPEPADITLPSGKGSRLETQDSVSDKMGDKFAQELSRKLFSAPHSSP